MGSFVQDARFAVRQFSKSPGFTIAAVLSFALGIGAATAMFSVLYGVLVDPYPYKDAGRMVHVQLHDQSGRGPLLQLTGSGYDAARQLPAVDDIFLQQNRTQTLTGERFPVSLTVGRYTPNLFDYMGVPTALGRGFDARDVSGTRAEAVAVLGYLFWRRQFGGNPDVVGKTIQIDHAPFTVIGVAARRFTWGDSDVYLPALPGNDPREYWEAFVKLKPGVSFAQAEAQLQVVVDESARRDRNFPQDRRVKLVTLNEQVLGRFAGTLVLLFGGVVLLLAIGCANVSILLLARGKARQHELAVRMSIGAGRQRIIEQLVTESVLLSLVGAILGVLVAYRGVDGIVAMLPPYSFPHEAAIEVNRYVLAFSVLIGVLTGILSGISPAWQLSRPQVGAMMQDAGGRLSGSRSSARTHGVLIASQVALTLVLVAGAGAAGRAFLARIQTPIGIDPDRVLALNVAFPRGANPDYEGRLTAQERLRRAIGEVSGVESVTISTSWFPPFGGFVGPIEVWGAPARTDAQAVLALSSADEFRTLRIPLRSGRSFDQDEVMRGARVAVVNETFARQFLDGLDPVGRRVRSPLLRIEDPSLLVAPNADDWYDIVGVVADARNDGLERPVRPAVFLPYSIVLPPDVSLFVRTAGAPEHASRAIRDRIRQLDPWLVVTQERSLRWWLDTQGWGRERFVARLFAAFAILALALAATGLYSVVSYGVTQRTREVGTRVALGAPRASIIRLVLASTGTMLWAGVAIGLALSIVLNRVVASSAGASPRDPLTLATATLVLVAVAAAACIVPAWRAATIDPVRALRTE